MTARVFSARPGPGPGRAAARAAGALAVACAVALGAQEAWLGVKARVAGALIDRAFAAHLADGRAHRPWPWADLHPLGSLEVERLDVRRVILSGASGSSLAFGIGHVDGTARPGSDGHTVLSGHRDTWAAFLEHLRPGDRIALRTRSGIRRFTVTRTAVVHERRTDLLEPAGPARLTLLTCWPFGALRGGPLRYAVEARADGPVTARSTGRAPASARART